LRKQVALGAVRQTSGSSARWLEQNHEAVNEFLVRSTRAPSTAGLRSF
jgi:hypothetical protein